MKKLTRQSSLIIASFLTLGAGVASSLEGCSSSNSNNGGSSSSASSGGASSVTSSSSSTAHDSGTSSSSSGTTTDGGDAATADASDGAAAPNIDYTFDTTAQGWGLLTGFCGSPPQVNVIPSCLATDAGDAGDAAAPPAPTVTWVSSGGNPGGALQVTVTFTGYNQFIDAVINYSTPLDATGKTLSADVMVVSGALPASGGIQVFAGGPAPNFAFAGSGLPKDLSSDAGTYTTLSVDLATASNFDPSLDGGDAGGTGVIQVGVQIFSGTPPTDGGAYPDSGEVTVLIDNVHD